MTTIRMFLTLLVLVLPVTGWAAADDALLSPPDAWAEARAGSVLIVDIRNSPEWAWTGVARGAARASWWQVQGESGFLADILQITGDDRTKPIALICARGVRSSAATAFLKAQGFTNVRDIGEGMLGSAAGPGWLQRKLPLE
ncbi:MAG: rhodanese-like domain-containing protein [Minwuia sp.]|nr:rhodanese-like domain-containing protein [Minwuia sp.]